MPMLKDKTEPYRMSLLIPMRA